MNYGEKARAQQVTVADQKASVRRYLSNTNALETVLADIAEGTKVTHVAERLNVSYHALYAVLTGPYKEQYKAARAAFAERLAEKNLDIADKIETLQLPPDAGKAAVGIRQWHMERTAGEQWGQRSSVDVTHKGVVGLHLEAIRQLSEEPVEGEIEDAEYEEVEDDRAGADSVGHDDDRGDTGDSVPDPLMEHPLL